MVDGECVARSIECLERERSAGDKLERGVARAGGVGVIGSITGGGDGAYPMVLGDYGGPNSGPP